MSTPSIAQARSMRKAPTDAEARLWHLLRNRQCGGFKFKRQVPIGPYIADFVSFETHLVVEADGGQHADSERDKRRDAWFHNEGFEVLRFWNTDILTDPEAVVASILAQCRKTAS